MGIGIAIFALRSTPGWPAWAALSLLALAYVVMTLSSVRLISNEKWHQGPQVATLSRDLAVRGERECMWGATRALHTAHEDNKGPYRKRLFRLRVAAWCLVAETVALLALGLVAATSAAGPTGGPAPSTPPPSSTPPVGTPVP